LPFSGLDNCQEVSVIFPTKEADSIVMLRRQIHCAGTDFPPDGLKNNIANQARASPNASEVQKS